MISPHQALAALLDANPAVDEQALPEATWSASNLLLEVARRIDMQTQQPLEVTPPPKRSRGPLIALATAAAVLLIGVVFVITPLGGGPAAQPRVTEGMWIENASLGSFPVNTGQYFPSPDGEQAVTLESDSWCIADLPAPESVGDVLPVTMGDLPSATPQLRCSDSLVITAPLWSPEGTRIAASDLEQTMLYVLDPSSLEIETTLDISSPWIWVSETEILYYAVEPQEAWYVVSVEGDELRTIPATRPGGVEAVLVGDATVIYRALEQGAFADPEAVEVGDLIALDWKAGTAKELAPLKNLNLDGQTPDPGFVTDMTSDLRYAVLYAATKLNDAGQGPNVYVYDLESESLIPHTPAASDPQTPAFQPYLVSDAWIAYTSISSASDESEPHSTVYIAPLDDPSAAIELFQDGLLLGAHNNRLTIIGANSQGLAILDIDF